MSQHTARLKHQIMYNHLMDALRNYHLDQIPLDAFPGSRILLSAREEDEDDAGPFSAEDALNYLLDESIDHFGYSARDVYHGVFNYDQTTRQHQVAFQINYDQLTKTVQALSVNDAPPHAHEILALIPTDSVAFDGVRWQVHFKSLWVTHSLIQRLGDAENTRIGQCISFFHRIQASQLAGQFLEPFAHRKIVDEPAGGYWPLTKMTRTNDKGNPPLFSSMESSPDSLTLFPKVKRKMDKFLSRNSEELSQNTYYIPEDPNFPLLDAFTFELESGNKSADLWVLQMTTSRLYGGSARGYREIRSIIAKLKASLKKQAPRQKSRKMAAGQSAPEVTVHVRYLLVVPKGNFDRAARQWAFPLGWDENWTRNDHRGEVYCLELPVSVEEIAARHS